MSKNSADDGIKQSHEIVGSTNRASIDKLEACPFCHTVKGDYNNEN